MNNKAISEKIKKKLGEKFGIEFGERLTLGNVCSNIFRAQQDRTAVVVKIGISNAEKREIKLNKDGYSEMKRVGAISLLPSPLYFAEIGGFSVIIIQDCGLDFWHATKSEKNPSELYLKLVLGLKEVYKDTRCSSDEVRTTLNFLKNLLIKQYQTFLFPVFGNKDEILESLQAKEMEEFVPKVGCFSSFDFTPEDVFVTASGIKYVDPLPGLVGVPIIDMACFAGVARDAYGLPGSTEGYVLLRKFAVETISEIVILNKSLTQKLFLFGRSLQNALSSRFRVNTEKERAHQFFKSSCCYCSMFLKK